MDDPSLRPLPFAEASVVDTYREKRYQATRFASLLAAGVNTLLAVMQVVAGYLLHSQALVADGVHTLSDLLSDGVVLFAARQAAAEPDRDHPYGHGRIETLATILVGVLLALAGLGIAWMAVQRLLVWETLTAPAPAALIFVCLTLVAKEGLYQYTHRLARRIDSPLLQANAWHHRSDALSSLVVLVGIGGAVVGWPWLDAVAALAVTGFILHMAGRLIFQGAAELIDTALDPEQVRRIEQSIQSVPGVKSVHMLRTRKLGNEAAADVHIQVAPMISVSEGHQIADEVYRAMAGKMPHLRDITVHVDPENDVAQARSVGLPMRAQLTDAIRLAWQGEPELADIEQVGLHYLAGRLHVTITLRLAEGQTSDQLQQRAQWLTDRLLKTGDWQDCLGEIGIVYHARTKLMQSGMVLP